ncbi:nucleoside triphosphate pyrophosphohydrolase [Xanthomonas oryzae pv. oryzae]|uniref:Nucleoside triphosphate pyrophosphohydrolase n=1 Tax=Xanthomonas oryzae pv. leersiae TaxID=3112258 RepID=A0AAJ6GW11_9XANT|nr:nucleoside triphosphate pyrophosphohydrolase [Xanthomonas oryzae]RBA84776.1 nucleoside triphosphate pyrophosphohydrolase [Xanthomonas oryzae pv. oryzae]RBB18976.1 nucleoside triphosphate pyrophosphohydrolase [Xanthomonas oryzae pv. oryzae]RBB72004.1 nucleoside triphosphate pyrophosphohydrolase [Xanthomonas oryzae pv. oryzae]RBB85658.1 nucleoside triphosphate pyrophosphohydrolase [Xanthomonas oryzae pv. oryzae]RBC08676.1 nucleoside triphosphate pyrophosphohydrolase [Xanthomonas oryzae pv. or
MSQTPPTGDIQQLLQLMARLRDREHGCPWDVQQTFASIAPYTIEEAYEVADAIDRNDLAGLRDELGDLLLQVVFHAQMAAEQGAFGFADVVATLSDKLVRRHPHVFAAQQVPDARAVSVNWEQIKREERRAAGNQDDSALAGIARGLPEWQRSTKLQSRAARVGFDWPGPVPVLEKLQEEIEELRVEFARGPVADNQARLEDELGDVLFVCANLARHAKVDVGAALRHANLKFERRFRAMEAQAHAAGTALDALSLSEQEALWQQVKRNERSRDVQAGDGPAIAGSGSDAPASQAPLRCAPSVHHPGACHRTVAGQAAHSADGNHSGLDSSDSDTPRSI